jgi:phosphoglycerol transferase MdoB-like AlkP superfamily enzyme
VSLIFYYVAFMVVGDFVAYLLGLFTEYEWGSYVSLVVFLALYFLSLWLSWVLAVLPNQNQRGRARSRPKATAIAASN